MRFRTSLLTAAACAAFLCAAGAASAQVSVSITIAPPVLPVYSQPAIPAAGYLWVPGYWAWADGGYYWVPGTWVEPPQPGLLWTPGYWGWGDGVYVWHEGYWGDHVGFYGGVHYGFGYDGDGYLGGYWSHGAFFYNTSVNRIPAGMHIGHVYHRPVPAISTRVSFNGGVGGLQVHATAAQLAAARGPHIVPVAAQRDQEQAAGRNPELRASNNHGRPNVAATARAGEFSGAGVVAARGGATRANVAHHGAGPQAVTRRAANTPHESTGGRPGEAPHAAPERPQTAPGEAGHEVGAPAHAPRAEAQPRVEGQHGAQPHGQPQPHANEQGGHAPAERRPEQDQH